MPRRRWNDDDLARGFNPEDTGTGPHPTPPDALLASIRAAYDEARETRDAAVRGGEERRMIANDSPRWCRICEVYGDHHTGRCPDMHGGNPSLLDPMLPLGDFELPAQEPTATIEERATAFYLANTWVLDSMIALADAYRARGATKVGVKHLAEVIRWEHGRMTSGDAFRFNNSYTSRFARLIIERRPDLDDLIETRALRAA